MARVLIVGAVLFSLLTAPAIGQPADGILMTQRVTAGGASFTVQVQIEAARMRTEMAGPDGVMSVTIFDGGRQVLSIVDPARKTYMEMTKADVDRLSAQMLGSAAQVQAQLEKVPQAQRAQMAAMMKGVQHTRTGSDTVGRWTCDKYDLTISGQKIGEVCMVNAAALGFAATDFDVMAQMGAFYSAMASLMPNQLPGVSGIDPRGSSDFPVRTVIMMGQGQTVTTTEVIEAGRRTFADSLFVVPAGFTKQDLPAEMGGQGKR